ncbi:ATP-binding protein [Streptomyces sp. AS02]|uniref:ATP-binding protein n=1 Tax=Streptomyces sp. AS02 TaxID=2938946 RepID=UPI002020CB29|nr:ATP-binding protein [Streptomyces sp. AS02]MCL8017688.1 putative DNA binding domain-containing protein [Streptomyces sp. AS02]
MQPEDLSGLLATLRSLDTDTSTIEAKRARGGLPAKMWETLSAFSNAQGGVILFGVDEKSGFSVTGVEDPGAMELALAKICSDSMEPPVRPLIQTFSIEGEKVVVAEIPAMSTGQKPCFYRGQGCYGGSYIRVGDNDRKLTDYEVNLLLSGRGQPKDDERVVEEASMDDLDPVIYQQFIAGQRRQRPRAFRERSDEQLLSMMKVVKIQDGRPVPTVAGLLAMGTYPQEFFPQLNLTFVVYPSTQMGAPGSHGERFLDNASLDGPISEMVSSALLRLQRNMRRRSIISGIARQDVWEYPETALREAIVNALAHRDLSQGSLGTPAQIEMYPDRLVIRNPGGLFGPVNVADLPTSHVSSARNQALLKLMEFVQLPDGGSVCEARGSGISSMIYALRAAGMGIPEFEDNVSSFSVTFPNASLLDEETVKWLGSLGEAGLTESQILALARMRNGESLNNNSYRSHLGVDSRVATAELRDLVDRGVAEQSGTRRWATYTLASSHDSRKDADQLSLGESDVASGSLSAPVAEIVGVVHDELATRILDLLGSRGPLTRKEIEEELGSATHNVLYRLRELKNSGRVEQTGAARSPKVRWRIKE